MTFLKILLVILSAAAALVIEIAFIVWYLGAAFIDVLLIGNEKAQARRMFK
jgi:hypothetical protein